MNVVHKWKKVLAVGCSHALHANPHALDAVVKFRESWNPDTVFHLGDFVDTAALRSGAKGSKDESSPVQPDIDSGLEFIDRLRPTIVLCGNHEARAWSLRGHQNAVTSFCATGIVSQIEARVRALGAELHPYTGIHQGRTLGGFRYMHGVFFSENATRDHAETYGNVVHAHTHRAGVAKGRRSDNPTGFSVGTLTDIPCMDYASTRRATLSWSAGFVWGYYCDDQSQLWLHEQAQGNNEWMLPA